MLDPAVAQALARSGKRIVITGAGGWLGLVALECLAAALGSDFGNRVVAFGSVARDLPLRDGTIVAQRPLSEIDTLPACPTWVLHFAFLTKDRADDMPEDAYRAVNAAIGATVLRALDPIGAEGVFVASSGAAYRAQDHGASAAMRLYGTLKVDDENRFAAWGERRGKRVVIGRVFNVTGPYINKHHAYALASFILDGLAGRTIAVRAPRPVVRGYVAIDELLSLVFAELQREGPCIVRFDSGGEPMELGEVAQVVAAQFPGGSVDRAPVTERSADTYHGDPLGYAKLLAAHGIEAQPLDVQVAKTIDYLRRAE